MQYIVSIALVITVSAGCYFLIPITGYKVIALVLLMTVTLLAMLLDILPVLIAAILSALIWNYFFIPPTFTFHIDNPEDLLMFLMYFLVALVNAILTFKIREAEKRANDKEEKEKSLKFYNILLNSLSHEIRTPLSTIIGAVDAMKESRQNLSPENNQVLLDEIDVASVRLNRQVENLLNMSRLENGMLQIKKDWCDINELIFSVIHKFNISVNLHKIIFKPKEELPLYRLDAGLIENVLHNLIHNATQYTPENSAIIIEAWDENESLFLTVSDNGAGFPENEIQSVFENFYRLLNTKAGGTGLGLSIVKGFVQAHNGKIILENLQEGGARFTIGIPADASFISNLKNE
jgi:two-component system sensor histidine kinase KdpD